MAPWQCNVLMTFVEVINACCYSWMKVIHNTFQKVQLRSVKAASPGVKRIEWRYTSKSTLHEICSEFGLHWNFLLYKTLYVNKYSIELTIPRRSLVAVVGTVGCGKSSLVSAILGEMENLNGDVIVNVNKFSMKTPSIVLSSFRQLSSYRR